LGVAQDLDDRLSFGPRQRPLIARVAFVSRQHSPEAFVDRIFRAWWQGVECGRINQVAARILHDAPAQLQLDTAIGPDDSRGPLAANRSANPIARARDR
jgi:hypothetical protein